MHYWSSDKLCLTQSASFFPLIFRIRREPINSFLIFHSFAHISAEFTSSPIGLCQSKILRTVFFYFILFRKKMRLWRDGIERSATEKTAGEMWLHSHGGNHTRPHRRPHPHQRRWSVIFLALHFWFYIWAASFSFFY